MEQASKQESLKQWYLEYIDGFRKKYELLSTDEKKGINNVSNFLNPCQIEVFWIADPNCQLVVQSNFNDRPDKEIIVNGPYESHEFQSKAITILKEKKWLRKFKENLPQGDEQFDTLGEKMAMTIYKFIKLSKIDIPTSQKNELSKSMGMAVDDTWTFIYAGNIEELDHSQEINKTIQKIKQEAKNKQERKMKPPQQAEPFANEKFDGFGVHLLPPVVIGAEYKRSIEELVHNTFNYRINNNKVLDMKIDNKQIIVNKDGFIFIENKSIENALKILNLIMAFGVFYKFPLYTVREPELVMTRYNKQDLTVANRRWYTETRRAYLMDNSFNLRYNYSIVKRKVNTDTIKEILSNTEKLLENEKLSEDMRLLNEGLTHFANSEFSPSFVMSWSVIERHCFNLYNKLRCKDISNKCLKKPNSKQQSLNSVLKHLCRQNEIDKNSYDRIMELKKKRNEFYHNGMHIQKVDADCCIKYATKLLVEKISPYINLSDSLILT